MLHLARLNAPVIAAVNGTAAGAGLGLVLVADLAIAARGAKFAPAYTAVGLTPDAGCSFLLPRAIGYKRAMELLLTNRVLDSERALEWGLVNQVVEDDQLPEAAAALAARLAAGATGAFGAVKRLMAESAAGLEAHFARESRSMAARGGSAKWGIEMTEGTITGWRVRVGEPVERGAEILDVETDKIVNAVESPASGVLMRITADAGETRAVGSLIGVIADLRTSDAEIGRFIDSFVGAVVSFEPAEPAEPSAPAAMESAFVAAAPAPWTDAAEHTGGAATDEARVSPIARRVAQRLGVDLSQVIGTGRNARISKEDVEAYAARTASAAPTPIAAESAVRRIPMSARRVTIARRLLESKQSIPHFRLEVDVDFGPLLRAKRAYAAGAAERVTVNDFVLRAVALALVRHPMVNAQLEGDEIVQFENADIAIAVSAEAGLITPILRSANLKSLAEIARDSRELIERARSGALQRDDITGGSFTVSNLGMYGVQRFDAIINAPQVAILAVGAVTPRAVVRNAMLAPADVATLTLSADHRVVDGAVGAAFLTTLRQLLTEPHTL
jgi:pyruvate dehydrogenase E2 component (dihydrolipoamide acetyltransferase)